MSHIVLIQTQVRDPIAVGKACERLHLPPPLPGRHRLFNTEVEGLGVQLPDWRYPLVCDLQSGQFRYDNFGERWGKQIQLDRFLQAYAVEMARIAARQQGHSCTEQSLADGSIKLTIQVGGAV